MYNFTRNPVLNLNIWAAPQKWLLHFYENDTSVYSLYLCEKDKTDIVKW